MLDDCDIFVAKFYYLLHYCAFVPFLYFSPICKTDIILTPILSVEKSCNNVAHKWYFFYFQKAS